MKLSTLVEHVADWHTRSQVDRSSRLVRNIALTGDTSKNGYRYHERALKEAVPLYEQRPVFLDHAADKSRPQERSTRDLVGSIINSRWESGRIFGDIRVLDTDSGRTFLALAESDAPGVGMSHVVLAEREKSDGAVARIHEVVSVDAVVFPATTTNFRDSHETSKSSEQVATVSCNQETADTSSSLLKRALSRPVAVVSSQGDEESLTGGRDSESESLNERLQQLLTERDELLGLLQEERLQRSDADREQAITQQLNESGLPDFAITEAFRRELTLADESLRRKLLEERQRLIETARRRPPLSRERATPSDTLPADAVFIAALKRHA